MSDNSNGTQGNEAQWSMDVLRVDSCSAIVNEETVVQVRSPPIDRNSLLDKIYYEQQDPKDICQEWIILYAQFPEKALVDLMQFMLEASGSQYRIPSTIGMIFNYTEILKEATLRYGNKSSNYPLVMRGSSSFSLCISQFVECLVNLLQNSGHLLDEELLGVVIDFVEICAGSEVRAFRHTCTLIALKTMSALGATVSMELDTLKRIWMQLYNNIFLERIRDVVDDIRYLCVKELGQWLEQFPHCYLSTHHVNHLFDALQDEATKVIECSFQALFKLIIKPELRAVCQELGASYRVILVNLTMGPENELNQMAIELIGFFYAANKDFLDESMQSVIEQFVFAAHRGVAQAAAKLVPYRCHVAGSEQEHILQLARFFLNFEEHEHAAYLVDAYYGHNSVILAWSTMIDMLMPPDSNELSVAEQSAIIEILKCAVKQAVTGRIPSGRYTENLVREAQPHAQSRITSLLLPKCSGLLKLYRGNPRDLCNLLELPQYMDLQGAQYDDIIEEIQIIMLEELDIIVLEMGATTLEHLHTSNCERYADRRKELLNNAVMNYKNSAASLDQCFGDITMENSAYRVIKALCLVSTLYARFDLYEWGVSESVLTNLQRILYCKSPSMGINTVERFVGLYLTILYISLNWDLGRIQENAVKGCDIKDDSRALRRRLDNFITFAFHLIVQSSMVKIKFHAFIYICDIFVLFDGSLRQNSNSQIRSLEYKSNIGDYELMESYLVDFVFTEIVEVDSNEQTQEAQIQLEGQRRVLSCYCKLVFNNVIPVMRMCVVLQHYDRYNKMYGDILRSTMERTLSQNPTNFGMTLMHTCLLVYKRIREKYPNSLEAEFSEEFGDLLKLAKLLAEQLFVKPLMVRPAILVLHRAGIRFAAEMVPADNPEGPPENLLYLLVMQRFVPQLLAQDVLDVLQCVQLIDHSANSGDQIIEWQPLLSYRNALQLAAIQSCRRADLYTVASTSLD